MLRTSTLLQNISYSWNLPDFAEVGGDRTTRTVTPKLAQKQQHRIKSPLRLGDGKILGSGFNQAVEALKWSPTLWYY
jgi:hypothetical protein